MITAESVSTKCVARSSARRLERGISVECDHTLHLADAKGRPCGSWEGKVTRDGIRFSCSGCGRFYGYTPKS